MKKKTKHTPIGTEISFKNRYGNIRKIVKSSDNSYTLEGEALFWRCAAKEDAENFEEYAMFDFEGGPYVETGLPVKLIGAFNDKRSVAKISLVESVGDYIKISIVVK